MHLAAGLSVGLSGVAAGYTIGVVGDAVWPMILHLVSGPPTILILTVVAGRSGVHATIASIRGHDLDLDFR